MKRIVAYCAVFLGVVACGLGVLAATEPGLRFLVWGSERLWPQTVKVERVTGRLLGAWQLDGIELSTSAARVTMRSLSASWHPAALVRGKFSCQQVTAVDLDVTLLHQSREPEQPQEAEDHALSLALPFAFLLEKVDVHNGVVRNIQQEEIAAFSRLSLRLAGDRQAITVSEFLLAATTYTVELHGSVHVGPEIVVDMAGAWDYAGEELAPLAGTFSAWGPMAALNLRLALNQPAAMQLEGTVRPLMPVPQWQLHLSAPLISLEKLNGAWPAGQISVDAELAGEGDQYRGHVHAMGDVLQYQGIEVMGEIAGTSNALAVNSLSASLGGATVQTSGAELSWRDGVRWRAELLFMQFDPAIALEGYDGRVDGRLTSMGWLRDSRIEGSLGVDRIEGVVRGYPVSGSGLISLDGGVYTLEKVHLASGNSRLHADGIIGTTLDLEMTASSPDLGEIFAGAKGTLELHGELAGRSETPRLEMQLALTDLHYDDVAIVHLDAHMQGEIRAGSQVQAGGQGTGLTIGDNTVDAFQFSLDGTSDHHRLQFGASSDWGNIDLQGNGKLQDNSWSGTLHNGTIDAVRSGRWLQQKEATLTVGADMLALDGLCLAAAEEQLCLLGSWSDKTETWQIGLDLSNGSLDHLNEWGLVAEPVRGTVTGMITAAGDYQGVHEAEGRLAVGKVTFAQSEADEELEQPVLEQGVLELGLAQQQLTFSLIADFRQQGTLKMKGVVDDFGFFNADYGMLPIAGETQINLTDLTFIEPLTRYAVRPSGALVGTLALTGSLWHPVLAGELNLADGKIELPLWGIVLSGVGMDILSNEETLKIKAVANSGPGRLEAQGHLSYQATRGVMGDFQLRGEAFDTIDLPEYVIRTSPDVHLVFDSRGGELTGRLHVPYGLIAPEEMTDVLSLSDDVVYVDGTSAVKVSEWQMTTSLEVSLGDDVRFDGYGLAGYLRGNLLVENRPGAYMTGKGELTFLDGSFSVYGRALEISRGRVIFAGGPIDNPGIDVRAQKRIGGDAANVRNYTVGVDVSGTVQELEFKLFSDPHMDESDILAYMVVGRSMSDTAPAEDSILVSAAKALGLEESASLVDSLTDLLPVDEMYLERSAMGTDDLSLVVGKRITDNLFLGYDHNFFYQRGEFKIRYDLGYGFSLESRSSGSITGADLFYSFER